MKPDKGKLILQGKEGTWHTDSIKGKIELFIGYSIMLFSVILIYFLGFNYGFTTIGIIIAIFLTFTILPLSLIALYSISFSLDAIYENGIESNWHVLIHSLRNKTFHRWEDISKIGYGEKSFSSGNHRRFVWIHVKGDEDKRATTGFQENDADPYRNDFFDILLETLKEKCPQAEWYEADWLKNRPKG